MARRKSDCVKWTLVLVLVLCSQYVYSRPQVDSVLGITSGSERNEELNLRTGSDVVPEDNNKPETVEIISQETSRSIESKIKTRKADDEEIHENSHSGIAVPVTMEELELENKEPPNESSTTREGISTWVLVQNPPNNENMSGATEPTPIEDTQKKQKPAKNKNKKPQNKTPVAKRPIIGSTNKADLVASGSAINDSVFNNIKDKVLSNVQKNKNTAIRSTTTTTTTASPLIEVVTVKTSSAPVAKVTKTKKTQKNKTKVSTTTTTTTTEAPEETESSDLLPMESKEHEIALKVSTPATVKKTKKTTSKKKKTKKRKTSKPKPDSSNTTTTALKTANKTKVVKTTKQPNNTATGPFTTQIYNYFSREVMPSVGVGVIGLAGLVGLASYFFYPFATPVRRTIDVDKKDDIYRHNAEEYANEGGQPEEEMLGTVLAGMPIHSKQKLNPYAGQTAYINRHSVKKDQDLRYRQVANNYDANHNVHYPQQKTGIAHGAVYPAHYNYNRYQYETRHAYTTEKKYDKGHTYSPYPAAEPIYAAPQVEPTGISSYDNDAASSVVYGVKPSDDSDFRPVYPYEGQYHGETTSNPVTYSPTSMYLGSNNEAEGDDNGQYSEEININGEEVDNKFVVGNVPKELSETATPVVVPEHGPRNFNRKRRNTRQKRSVVGSIEELLRAAKQNKENEIFISNEVDEGLEEKPVRPLSLLESMQLRNEQTTPKNKEVFTVFAVSVDPAKEFPQTEDPNILKNGIIESVSTIPLAENKDKTTESEMSNEIDATTKSFKVYEVFPTSKYDVTEKSSPLISDNTETTTEVRSETTSTMPPSPPPVFVMTSRRPRPTYRPDVVTYPPLQNNGGFLGFLRRFIDFKYRLGLSILQNTSESLNRYLRSLDDKPYKG